ncbi:MAG TPA: RidA family protein [Cyclobacteriaceae bacterium]|jgi:enamine deaminase RidA (YjgF/YER057c/UK114 family)
MTTRKSIPGGAIWEDTVGYSRAVQVGNHLEISGTVAADEDLSDPSDLYKETRSALLKIQRVLEGAGFSLGHVVRTRMFVTDISRWEDVGRAHGEFFRDIRPATSMIEVKSLIDPRYHVEIEVTAIRG